MTPDADLCRLVCALPLPVRVALTEIGGPGWRINMGGFPHETSPAFPFNPAHDLGFIPADAFSIVQRAAEMDGKVTGHVPQVKFYEDRQDGPKYRFWAEAGARECHGPTPHHAAVRLLEAAYYATTPHTMWRRGEM